MSNHNHSRKTRGGSGIFVSGNLSGSNGTLALPVGVSTITFIGRGGPGGDNTVYYPGQPYIAPSGEYYVWTYNSFAAGSNTADPGYGLEVGSFYWEFSAYEVFALGDGLPALFDPSTPGPTILPPLLDTPEVFRNMAQWRSLYDATTDTTVKTWEHFGVTYRVRTLYSNPGQPYIPPSTTGGPYIGVPTTTTNGQISLSWPGGDPAINSGIAATTAQVITNNTASQVNYTVPVGGTLHYSYEY